MGGMAGGITLLALVIFLLLCWHRRRRHAAPQSVGENGDSEPLIMQFNGGGGSLVVSASGMPYTQPLAESSKPSMATVTVFGGESFNTDTQANMPDYYQTLPSGEVVLSPPGSQQLPSSGKALPSSTSNSSVLGTSSNNDSASLLNVTGTREEVRRARQKDLDDRLRVVQHNIEQLEGSGEGHERLGRQTSEEAESTEEEMYMSMSDMQEAIRSQREQIRLLREQQHSAWALGLSDDPPPGYTPMEVDLQIPREASS